MIDNKQGFIKRAIKNKHSMQLTIENLFLVLNFFIKEINSVPTYLSPSVHCQHTAQLP